jgi:hypothetical protein
VVRILSTFFPEPQELTSPPRADREQYAAASEAVAGGLS